MTFTYRDTIANNRDRVRFWLQDTEDGNGPKPGNGNFSDAELDGLIALEGRWELAVAAGFEILASAWQPHTSFSVFNGSYSRSDASKGYLALAEKWRSDYGYEGGALDGLAGKTEDFSGDTVTPLFQRKAFGHKVTDWDSA